MNYCTSVGTALRLNQYLILCIFKYRNCLCQNILYFIYTCGYKLSGTLSLHDGHFSDILLLLKNGQTYDSFADNFRQCFKYTTPHIELSKCITFKVVKQINPIGSIKTYTKNNCNIYMDERLATLKGLRDKRITLMKNNSDIYRTFWHKKNLHWVFLNTDDPLSRKLFRMARRSSIYMLQLCFVNFFIEPIGLSCFTTDYFFNLVVPIKSFPVLKLPLTFLNCKVWKDVVWSNPFTLYMRSSVFRKTQWKYFCARRPCIYPIFFYKRDAFVT